MTQTQTCTMGAVDLITNWPLSFPDGFNLFKRVAISWPTRFYLGANWSLNPPIMLSPFISISIWKNRKFLVVKNKYRKSCNTIYKGPKK